MLPMPKYKDHMHVDVACNREHQGVYTFVCV